MLKKILLASVVITSVSSAAFAGSWALAPIAGYRLNNMSDSQGLNGYSSTTGYQLGGLLLYSFLDTLALRTGVIYAVRDVNGTSANFPGGGAFSINFTDHISYLDVPADILFRLRPTGFYLFGGVKFGFKSSENCTANAPGVTCNISDSGENTILNLGLGDELIDLNVFRLALEAEYESGLSNINTTSGSSDTVKTSGFAFNLVAYFGP